MLPIAAFGETDHYPDGYWPSCKKCMFQTLRASFFRSKVHDHQFAEMPTNQVGETLIHLIQKHGPHKWAMFIDFDDYNRVRLQLSAWIAQLDGVWRWLEEEGHRTEAQTLACLKKMMDQGPGPSNAYADQAWDKYEACTEKNPALPRS